MKTLRNLTDVDTIYKTKIKTFSIKIKKDYLASDDLQLKTLTSTTDVNQVITSIFQNLDDDQEHFVLLILNQAHDLTGYKLISSGAQSYTAVDCKVLFRNALLLGASGIILAHNHPSGETNPSQADIETTKKIIEASELLDIDVWDHIIYTHKGCISLRETHLSIFRC